MREGWVVVVVDRETLGGDWEALGGDWEALGGDWEALGGDWEALGGDWEALGGGELVAVPHEGKRTCSAKTDDSYASRPMSRLQKPFHSWVSWTW